MERACFESVAKQAHQSIPSTACTWLEYSWLTTQEFSHEENNTVTFYLQMGSPKNVSVDEEYLIYDFVAMIGAIGGTLGLCIGFSFFDSCGLIISYLEQGFEKLWTKRGKRVVPSTIVREVRPSYQIINEKLEAISESVAKIEVKFSAMENKMRAFQIRLMQQDPY